MFVRVGFASILLACTAVAGASTQEDWARKMFDHLEFDFGTVARGAKAEHVFTITNPYLEPARISSVRSTCGCTAPELSANSLATYEKVQLKAVLNTTSFQGPKEAVLAVRFEEPFPAEVSLKVKCFIRSDVVVQPGAVNFGNVLQGVPVQTLVKVQYAGRDDWKITRVEHTHPDLLLKVFETARSGGNVAYELDVALREGAAAGYLKDQLVLVTNDPNPYQARVPITVEANVYPTISVHPSPMMLPVAAAGAKSEKAFVVRSKTPVRVLGVDCDDSRFKFTLPEGSKSVHLLKVEFQADARMGFVNVPVQIRTDLAKGAVLNTAVQVQVIAGPNGPAAPPATAPAAATPKAEPKPAEPGRLVPVLTPPGKAEPPSRPADGPRPPATDAKKPPDVLRLSIP